MGKPKLKFEFSVDDGGYADIDIARALIKRGLTATFYIPNKHTLSLDDIMWLHQSGFEIGGHTVNHPMDLKLLTTRELDYEIQANKLYLEAIIDKDVAKFCYPRGRYNKDVIDAVERAGYRYARTTTVEHIFMPDPMRYHTSVHIFPRPEYKEKIWQTVYIEQATKAAEENGTFHAWCHSADIERFNYWYDLYKMLQWTVDTFDIQ